MLLLLALLSLELKYLILFALNLLLPLQALASLALCFISLVVQYISCTANVALLI